MALSFRSAPKGIEPLYFLRFRSLKNHVAKKNKDLDAYQYTITI